MGFDGSTIKKQRKQRQGDALGDINTPPQVESAAVSTFTLSDFFFTGWGKGISILAGFLLICLMLVPFLTSMFKVTEADLKEQAFDQSAANRIDSLKQSFSGLALGDPHLLECIKAAALARGNVNPMDSGGIDAFSQLPMLTCTDMKITSIQGISSLPELTYLNLDYNTIEDIFELQNLPKLQTLSLAGNPVKNISTLLHMKNLRKVVLADLPEIYCFEIHNAVANVESNVDSIQCRGKWSLAIKEISDKNVTGRPLSYEEEKLLYDYQHNQDFMPKK